MSAWWGNIAPEGAAYLCDGGSIVKPSPKMERNLKRHLERTENDVGRMSWQAYATRIVRRYVKPSFLSSVTRLEVFPHDEEGNGMQPAIFKCGDEQLIVFDHKRITFAWNVAKVRSADTVYYTDQSRELLYLFTSGQLFAVVVRMHFPHRVTKERIEWMKGKTFYQYKGR